MAFTAGSGLPILDQVRYNGRYEEIITELLEKLQTAIASGDCHEAANIAFSLATRRVMCNINAADVCKERQNLCTCGMRSASLNDVIDNNKLPNAIALPDNVPIVKTNLLSNDEEKFSNYLELLNYENTDLVTNLEEFECPICFTIQYPGDGVVLKTCLHSFCKDCLGEFIRQSENAQVKCPYTDDRYSCGAILQEREIKGVHVALVSPQVYERYLTRSINEAESKIPNTFHCRTANCTGWCVFEDDVNHFQCPVCFEVNCLTCQVIHTGMNCLQYQEELKLKAVNNQQANESMRKLEEMVIAGEAMKCPTCKIIIMKKSGCDALMCTMCKTEICWVTKGPRWGPAGHGDISGGCRCRVNGVMCHPNCGNCH